MRVSLRRAASALLLVVGTTGLPIAAPAEPVAGGAATRSTSLDDLGRSLFVDGRYAEADSVLRQAVAARRESDAAGDTALARTLLVHAEVLKMIGAVEEARIAAKEAHALYQRTLGDDSAATADALGRLAALEHSPTSGDHETTARLEATLREVLARERRLVGPDHPNIAWTLHALGWIALDHGDEETAETLHRDALAMERRVLDPDDPALVGGLFALAFTAREVGELEEAIGLLREALAILDRRFERHPWITKCRNGVAIMENELGHPEEAARLMRMNLDDSLRMGETLTPRFLHVQTNLALVYINLRRFDSADSLLGSAEAGARDLATRGIDVAEVQNTLTAYRSREALQRGAFADAERLTLVSLERHRSKLDPGHEGLVQDYSNLAAARWGAGDIAGAERYLDQAIRVFETARTRSGSGIRRATFAATPYEARALCRLELGKTAPAWEDIAQTRGRLLRESLLGEDEGPLPLERVQAALGPDEALVGWVDGELVSGQFRSWGYVLRNRGPVLWERLPGDESESLSEKHARHAGFRDAIVEAGYSAFPDETAESRGEVAAALWRERFASLTQHLKGVASLVLVPSPMMGSLPVEALLAPDGTLVMDRFAVRYAPSADVYAWLAEQAPAVETAPRSGLLVGDPPFRPEHLLAWVPDPQETDLPARPSTRTLRKALARDHEALGALPRLPWSRTEVESIQDLLPRSTTLLGADASRTAVLRLAAEGALSGFDVLHFATHALVDEVDPERSALILAQTGPGEDSPTATGDTDDGAVTARDIEDWELHAELVTLSACETARGRAAFGEGTVNFAYPFFRAGSSCLLASLWTVNDEASSLLMERFYANWLGAPDDGAPGERRPRMSKARALGEAKLWLRDWRDARGDRPYAHPYYWASFVLIGY